MPMQCQCNANAMPMQCHCNAEAMPMQCNANAIHSHYYCPSPPCGGLRRGALGPPRGLAAEAGVAGAEARAAAQ
eukprot:7280532-Lingulodinium_polyedra.AAC.1